MTGLALAACTGAPGAPAPAGLCALTSREAIEHHLLDAFVSAAFLSGPGGRRARGRRAGQAERWLMFLAHHLDHHISSDRLAWWQLSQAAPSPRCPRAFPVTAGLATGITAGLAAGPGWGLSASLAGLAAGFLVRRRKNPPVSTEDQQPRSLPRRRYFTSPQATLRGARVSALAAAASSTGSVAVTVAIALAALEWARGDGAHRKLLGGWPEGLCALAGVWFIVFAWYRLAATATWPRWAMTRTWLARRGLLPWRLIAFLAEARDRGVLRQDGAFYQFCHKDLQHHLATHHHGQCTATPPQDPQA